MRPGWPALAGILLLGAISLGRSAPAGGEEVDVPSYELTESELKLARELADAPFAAARAEKQPTVVHFVAAELYRDKAVPRRLARATHYRPADDVTIYTIVDLARASVIGTREVAHTPTALAEAEFAEARALALADPAVKSALGADIDKVGIEPMVLRTQDRDDPFFGHRVVRVLFHIGPDYLTRPVVVVDITARKVILEAGAPLKGAQP